MPSTPLRPDTSAVVKLKTRIDVEAIDITKGRTDRPAAVARLVQLVPPSRVDLVDEVLARIGRRRRDDLDWPPRWLTYELAWRVKRAHAGERRLRGPSGEIIDVIAYIDTAGRDRRVYRLHRHGVFIGEYKTPRRARPPRRPRHARRGRPSPAAVTAGFTAGPGAAAVARGPRRPAAAPPG